ncbi:leucine-rich repeat-containing protein 46 [Heteronotia binoei]|uniref:leucine-rich repeat-containing protein 46 n=1 Tax=Heteronotia binoei TaxID=13085 RepID=UPI00292DEFAE|nr:leucine-rich repeat-containing protein 46 [Heteronotia binoei]
MPGENIHSSSKEGANLTKSLIAQRNLFAPVEKESLENLSQALAALPILRLDRERISRIPELQGLEQIHSIYLQQNQIEKIENLSCFPNLKFLSLAGNRISRVENLQALLKLQFLDLSHNHIESLDTDELPQSLVILDLTGNKCIHQKGYRESVLAALPHLVELDSQHVPDQRASAQSRKEAEESSGDSDEDIPELSQPLSTEKDFFVDLHKEFTSRSERRRREALSEHEAHLEELKERQNLRHLLLNPSSQAPSPPDPQTPTLEAPAFQTECHGSPSRSLKTASSTFHEELSMRKEKATVSSQIQGKGEVSSTAKCVRKAKK